MGQLRERERGEEREGTHGAPRGDGGRHFTARRAARCQPAGAHTSPGADAAPLTEFVLTGVLASNVCAGRRSPGTWKGRPPPARGAVRCGGRTGPGGGLAADHPVADGDHVVLGRHRDVAGERVPPGHGVRADGSVAEDRGQGGPVAGRHPAGHDRVVRDQHPVRSQRTARSVVSPPRATTARRSGSNSPARRASVAAPGSAWRGWSRSSGTGAGAARYGSANAAPDEHSVALEPAAVQISQTFDVPPIGHTETRIVHDRSGGEVWAISVDAKRSLGEYLQKFYKVGRAMSVLDKFGAVDFATTIAPGLRDVLLIGKVYEAAGRRSGQGSRRPHV